MSASNASRSLAATIATNIRAARQGSGLTQRQLADRVGVVESMAVSNWERGVNRPKDEHIVAVAEMTGRDVSWFYTDHDTEPQAAA